MFLPLPPTLSPRVPHILRRFFPFILNFTLEVKDLRSTIKSLRSYHSSNLYSIWDIINERNYIVLRAYSNLTAISSYVNHIKERIYPFTFDRRDMDIRE